MLIVVPLGLFIVSVVFWVAIPAGTGAKRIGLLHGGTMVLVVGLFAFVWWTRYNAIDITTSTNLFTIEVAALIFGSVGGWLGGELVDRLGVGVDDGAHLNAPSSLSGLPAFRREASEPLPQRRAG